MGSDASEAGIGKVNGAVAASTTCILDNSPYAHAERFTANARVMIVKPDGRTITDGYAGDLYLTDVDTGTDQLTFSRPVDIEDDGLVVFWHPGAVQSSGTDNVYTDLEGSFKFKASGNEVCATNITLTAENNHIDKNNCFGSDVNLDFVPANRLDITLEATLDLSNDVLGDLVQARKFGGFTPELIVGETTGRHLKITAPKWITSVPPKEIPENGTVPVTFSGNLYQSTPGAEDPIVMDFL